MRRWEVPAAIKAGLGAAAVLMMVWGCTPAKPGQTVPTTGASASAQPSPPADLEVSGVSFRDALTRARDAYGLKSPVLVLRRGDPPRPCQGVSQFGPTTQFVAICDDGAIGVGQKLADDMTGPPAYTPVAVVYELAFELAGAAHLPERPNGTALFPRLGQQICAGAVVAWKSPQWKGPDDARTLAAFVTRKLDAASAAYLQAGFNIAEERKLASACAGK